MWPSGQLVYIPFVNSRVIMKRSDMSFKPNACLFFSAKSCDDYNQKQTFLLNSAESDLLVVNKPFRLRLVPFSRTLYILSPVYQNEKAKRTFRDGYFNNLKRSTQVFVQFSTWHLIGTD